jgi:putative ABC transport system ATP-binding protein
MNREHGTTFIFSTHDASIVGIADHVVRLKDGLIVEEQRRKGGGNGDGV